ncbi:hypothetical protein EAI69_23435 [Escherichia coli]|nr:hypothetical protein EAI69_23435 [Escherichia coli]
MLPAGTALFTKQRRASPDDGLITQSIRAAATAGVKSITGRRAHNPIHPGGCHRRCSSLFCGETNRPCGGIY